LLACHAKGDLSFRQETFVRVMKALRQPGGIQSAGGFGAFVNRVCNNVLFEMYRSHSKATPLEEEAGAAVLVPTGIT